VLAPETPGLAWKARHRWVRRVLGGPGKAGSVRSGAEAALLPSVRACSPIQLSCRQAPSRGASSSLGKSWSPSGAVAAR
jgi:hypothetical protein